MHEQRTAPYGTWDSPITPDLISQGIRLSDVRWDGDSQTLVWLEQRSDRGVLVCQSIHGGGPRELTSSLSVRAEVGYGGGDFTVAAGNLYFVCSGRIYSQKLSEGLPKPITPAWGAAAEPAPSPEGDVLAYVHSHDDLDVLAVAETSGESWPAKLAEGNDFYSSPAWHPAGDKLAWVARDHPNMPWDGAGLYIADLDRSGKLPVLSRIVLAAGDPKGRVAHIQPRFSPDGRSLGYLCDEGGWLIPWVLDVASGRRRALTDEECEYGGPSWTLGLRSYAWAGDSKSLYAVRSVGGASRIVRLSVEGAESSLLEIPSQAGSHLAQIDSIPSPAGDRLAWIGSSPALPARIVSLQDGRVSVWRRSASEVVPRSYVSVPRPLEIPVRSRLEGAPDTCYGLFYPATNPDFTSRGVPPAIVSIHGGPTSQSVAEHRLESQFFTSRGYAVLELNYRGSTGFGRAFVDALRGNWGLADVEDVVAAAEHLARAGLVDPDRIVVSGGSAGGFTALLCLIKNPGKFKAAICRYGVSNLFELAEETHKFESHYLDSLIGPLPDATRLYRERSPIFFADRIRDPIAIYQGDEDRVVPRSQSDAIVSSLKNRGIPYVYEVFPGEGHGFRKRETLRSYYRSVELFLRRYVVYAF